MSAEIAGLTLVAQLVEKSADAGLAPCSVLHEWGQAVAEPEPPDSIPQDEDAVDVAAKEEEPLKGVDVVHHVRALRRVAQAGGPSRHLERALERQIVVVGGRGRRRHGSERTPRQGGKGGG